MLLSIHSREKHFEGSFTRSCRIKYTRAIQLQLFPFLSLNSLFLYLVRSLSIIRTLGNIEHQNIENRGMFGYNMNGFSSADFCGNNAIYKLVFFYNLFRSLFLTKSTNTYKHPSLRVKEQILIKENKIKKKNNDIYLFLHKIIIDNFDT